MSMNSKLEPPAHEDKEVAAILDKLHGMRFLDAVQGKEIYNFFGGRVLEHTTATGHVLAIKVKSNIDNAEADMTNCAATHGIRAPTVRGVYDIVSTKCLARTMTMERVPGVPLADVWQQLSAADKSFIKDQLRTQLELMRACTQTFIGRVGRQETRNVYSGLVRSYFGPFADEKAFDNWCLAHIFGSPLTRFKWQRFLGKERKKQPAAASFVLTHGDLTPRNIMVQGNVVTGIIDWEQSGFFPEYAEYAFAMMLCHSHEEWWIPVLEELLPHCSRQRLEFTELVEEGVTNS